MSAASEAISADEAADLFGVLSEFSPLVLAVSGGPDSTALMWLAARWRDGLERPLRLIAATVDHGLRKESAREARAVKALAGKLKIEHVTLRWAGKKPKTGIQEAARNARYRLLSELVRASGGRHLLTAHTLDDQAETVLFRMARGSGISGLSGMRWLDGVPVPEGQGVTLIRPLLHIPKARLVATLKAARVPYAVDPSNRDPRFARPRFRKLMPLLAREGLTAERFGKLAQRADRVEEALFAILNDVQFELCPGPWPEEGPVSVAAEAFVDLPDEIGLRLLQRLIANVGNEGAAELGQLEALHAELTRLGGDIRTGWEFSPLRRTLAGALVTLTRDKLTVERAPTRRTAAKTGNRKRKAAFTKPR